MQHNLEHELKQNAAIEHLALALAGLASRVGASEYRKVAEDVLALLKADDAEPGEAGAGEASAPEGEPAAPEDSDVLPGEPVPEAV